MKLCNHNLIKIQGLNGHTLFPSKGAPSIVDLVISKIIQPLKLFTKGDNAFSDEDKANAIANTFLNCHKISINSHSPYSLVVDQKLNMLTID